MPSAPSLAHKHPLADYPTGSDIKSANKLSFSIDSLVGAAKCAADTRAAEASASRANLASAKSQADSRPSSATGLRPGGTPSPPQVTKGLSRVASPPASVGPRRPPHDVSPPHHQHQHPLHSALFGGVRNPVPLAVGQPHPFAPHLGFLNGAARSPFADYQSAAFYPWLLARQSPLGHMHGKWAHAIT